MSVRSVERRSRKPGSYVVAGPDGRFHIEGLAPGPQTIHVRVGPGPGFVHRLELHSDRTVDLRFAAARFEGRLTDPAGEPLGSTSVFLARPDDARPGSSTRTGASGRFVFPAIPPGRYVVTVGAPEEPAARFGVEVPPGPPTVVEWVVPDPPDPPGPR